MAEKCFCHFNGYQVKDATARKQLEKIDKEMVEKGTTLYTATPETLQEIVAKANPGSVIQLQPGNYARIDLHGKTAYPENLTITGCDGAIVDGVSISSCVPSWELVRNHRTTDLTITKATMPAGLTFKSLNFTDSFSLRNAQLENLSIIECKFAENTNISITPSYFRDNYGNDHNGNYAVIRPSYAQLTVNNLIIRNCTIENSTVYQYSGSTSSAIQVIGVNGANISNNTVNACISSGILVGGVAVDYDVKCTGKVFILDNKLHNCARGIRVYDLYNGELVISNNQLTANSVGVNDGYIRVSTCYNNAVNFGVAGSTLYPANTYEGNVISQGNGISVYDCSDVSKATKAALEEKADKAETEKAIAAAASKFDESKLYEITNGVNLSFDPSSSWGGTQLNIETSFPRFFYCPATGITYFECGLFLNGTLNKGERVCFIISGAPMKIATPANVPVMNYADGCKASLNIYQGEKTMLIFEVSETKTFNDEADYISGYYIKSGDDFEGWKNFA